MIKYGGKNTNITLREAKKLTFLLYIYSSLDFSLKPRPLLWATSQHHQCVEYCSAQLGLI